MHPIEWLRAIARSDDLPHAELAAEAAAALAALADDPRGMVPACRRLLDRHAEVGPLWWACARLLSADDAVAEARAIRNDLHADQVGLSLALDLPQEAAVALLDWSPLAEELAERRPDLLIDVLDELDDDAEDHIASLVEAAEPTGAARLLLVEAWAAGEGSFLGPAWLESASAAAERHGLERWLLVGVGRRLPEPLFRASQRRQRGNGGPPRGVEAQVFGLDGVSRTVEPLAIACPCPPELL